MYKFFISFCLFLVVFNGFSQDENIEKKDSISYKTAYGLRVGLDISKPIFATLDANYEGLELIADFRFSKNLYIAAEFGYEKNTSVEDFSNSTVKGTYAKIGININAYENWLDMNNEISIGFRYGLSLFDQTLNSFTPNVNTHYFPANLISTPKNFTGLTAHWAEFSIGMRVETFKNLFVSARLAYKQGISIEDAENFKTLYVPGFNRVYLSNNGFGFNYTISYLIPFFKK